MESLERYMLRKAVAIKKSELNQKSFHKLYCSEGHQRIEHTLIDRIKDLESFRKREQYWINGLNTSTSNGLNVREFMKFKTESKEKKNFFRKS